MKWADTIPVYGASAVLAIALAIPNAAFAQRRQAPPPAPRPEVSRPHPEHAQQGHVGDWLRHYADLPPEERERALQNDPAFRHLPPARQEMLRQRLEHFSNLPPQQQLRMLNRMETWEHLTPEQKQEARQLYGQFHQLPPDRQRMVKTAVEDLRAMPPDQREQVINSDRFKGMFSDQERDLMRGAARLPLAPPNGGEPAPQQ